MGYNIIRNLRGGWPNWTADLDDGRKVFIYIRYGEVRIGVGDSYTSASDSAAEVPNEWGLGGVSDCVDALVTLRHHGFHYVCEGYGRQ